ncbi:MAG: hypothetical protein WCT37_04125, partial [Patescibacteria group bacterium]
MTQKPPLFEVILTKIEEGLAVLAQPNCGGYSVSEVLITLKNDCWRLSSGRIEPESLEPTITRISKALAIFQASDTKHLTYRDEKSAQELLEFLKKELTADLAANTLHLKEGDWVFFVTPVGSAPIGSLESPLKVTAVTGDKFVGNKTIIKINLGDDTLGAI